MTKNIELYWHSNRDWWHYDGYAMVINEDAPKEAKESYKRYLKQIKSKERKYI